MLGNWSEGTECHWCGRTVQLFWGKADLLDRRNHPVYLNDAHGRGYFAFFSQCPSPDCARVMIGFAHQDGGSHDLPDGSLSSPSSFTLLWPRTRTPAPMPNVPGELFGKYAEATAVLGISPDASAAMTRRIVEQVLDEQDFKQDTLVGKIAAFRESDSPKRLKESIDYLRTLGNWAVHPPRWQAAGEIVAVEEEEAEWALDLVRDLFQHFYVEPAEDARRRDAIDAKRSAKNAE